MKIIKNYVCENLFICQHVVSYVCEFVLKISHRVTFSIEE